jgi:hypothetical protein
MVRIEHLLLGSILVDPRRGLRRTVYTPEAVF